MKKVIIKFEQDEDAGFCRNPLEVLQCEKIEFPNDNIFGVITDTGEVLMWPIRRIKSIRVQNMGDDN